MANVALLTEALAEAESKGTAFQIDQVAFMIGAFPVNHWIRKHVTETDCPKIAKLLPEIEPCVSEQFALLRLAEYMNKDNLVGHTADRIRRAVRG